MDDCPGDIKTGTTIVAIRFNEGVIMAADSKTSIGSYVHNRGTNKLSKISSKIYFCRSGSAADTQTIVSFVSYQTKLLASIYERKPLVKDAANLARSIVYNNPFLCASLIIAGYDEEERGSLYSINIGGSLLKKNWFIGGSGSAFLYGHCDEVYMNDMTFEEIFNMDKKLVQLAIKRDNLSGGCIRMAVIRKEGFENIFIPGNEV